MQPKINKTFTMNFFTIFILSILNTNAHAGWDEGNIAYVNKDYRTAFNEFNSLANQGDYKATEQVAFMYYSGEGVTQNLKKAEQMFKVSAKNNLPYSQFFLGSMYANGKGVERSHELGYFYLLLSTASYPAQNSVEMRDSVAERLNNEQIQRIQQMASNWKVGMPLPELEQ